MKKQKEDIKSININSTLADDLLTYSKLLGKGYNRKSLIETLIKDFLEDKIITNKGIKLKKPCYFNIEILKEPQIIELTEEEPIININNHMVLNKIPNNLDTWNSEYKTFCYKDNKTQHRGLQQYLIITLNEEKQIIIMPVYALFIYDLLDNETKLKIGILPENDANKLLYKLDYDDLLNFYCDLETIETKITQFKREYVNDCSTEEDLFNYVLTREALNKLLEDMEFIEDDTYITMRNYKGIYNRVIIKNILNELNYLEQF